MKELRCSRCAKVAARIADGSSLCRGLTVICPKCKQKMDDEFKGLREAFNELKGTIALCQMAYSSDYSGDDEDKNNPFKGVL